MKYIKKIITIILILLSIVPSIAYSPKVEAKTIADLRRELDDKYAKEQENDDNIALNQNEINAVENEIGQIYSEIDSINNTIKEKEEEIVRLNEEIEEKDKSSKSLMASLQTTTGNSFYIEYLFGSTSITDFIYRYSITEQITSYNERLIKEMNEKITEAKNLKVELANKEVELEEKRNSLATKLATLESSKVKLYELSTSIEDEIRNAKKIIQMYVDAGCGENDDISVCANTKLPPDTQFWRPFEYGYVSSEYGYRGAIYLNGKLISSTGIHEGIDLTNGLGSANKIYAVANGKVAAVWYDQWGGNQITIHHNINGKSYSSSYAHLSKTLVKVGDIVSKDTVIGMMGSTGNSTGPHLHLAISTGLRFTEYRGQSAYVARTVNPRSLINLPSKGSWKDRITKYN